jgi:hypothetical protein
MDRNQQQQDRPDDHTGKNHGAQGIDQAPGKETAGDLDNFVSDTQKGKNKVDGDPSLESDQPVDTGR